MQNTIEIAPINTKEAKVAEEESALMLVKANTLTISTQENYENAAEVLKSIKNKYKDFETKRKSITSPLLQAQKAVMELFRRPLSMLQEAEKLIKKGMITYTDVQENIRLEQEAKLRRQAEAEEAKKKKALEERAKKAEEKGDAEKAEELREQKEQVAVEAPVLAQRTEAPKGVSYKTKWTALVVDKTKMPIEYLEPNMSMLNQVAQATKGKLIIPGVEFKSEKIVASRSL